MKVKKKKKRRQAVYWRGYPPIPGDINDERYLPIYVFFF